MLQRFFSRLDALAAELGIFKVETIGASPTHPRPRRGRAADGCARRPPADSGDCYICAAGIPEWQPDHALRIARFGLGAVDVAMDTLIDEEDPSKGHIMIRVGFHCGSIVASLIARKYTLLGGECPEPATGSPQSCTAASPAGLVLSVRAAACTRWDQTP